MQAGSCDGGKESNADTDVVPHHLLDVQPRETKGRAAFGKERHGEGDDPKPKDRDEAGEGQGRGTRTMRRAYGTCSKGHKVSLILKSGKKKTKSPKKRKTPKT